MTSPFLAACIQMRSGRDVAANIEAATALIREAAAQGAHYVQTPEMTTLVERDRECLFAAIKPGAEDDSLAKFQDIARSLSLTLHIGSMAVRVGDKVANRAFVINPQGEIVARYDKIHLFDVDLANGESWRESATYQAGDTAVIVSLPSVRLGLSICYDLRFPKLYQALAQAGADILTSPACFTRQTGEAHWHVLQRARAIETGSFMISAAQGGVHDDGRETYGHSLIIDPWGRILAEADHDRPGVILASIDLSEAESARSRIPCLRHERSFRIEGFH